jgi:hypothetical protein
MSTLLDLDLLGRAGAAAQKLPFHLKVFVYALNFPLSDVYTLMHACSCQKVAHRAAPYTSYKSFPIRCSCPPCSMIHYLRRHYIFFGPSPRAMHCALMRECVGTRSVENITLDLFRKLLRWFNEAFAILLCLYILQMLPCIWRKFIRLVRQAERLRRKQWSILFASSKMRTVRLHIHALESDRINSAFDWLSHLEWLGKFWTCSKEKRLQILSRFRWGREIDRRALAIEMGVINECPSPSSD